MKTTAMSTTSLFAIVFVLVTATLVGAVSYPQYTDKYVNDFAGVFSSDQISFMRSVLSSLEESTTAQVVVVTVDSLEGMASSQYATELATKWGVGKSDVDNGLLILYAKTENKIFAATGYGLEGILPDSKLGRLLDENYVPLRDSGDVSEGIIKFTESVLQVIEDNSAEVSSGQAGGSDELPPYLIVFFAIMVLIFIVPSAISLRPSKCKTCGQKMKYIKTEPGPMGSGYDYRIYRCPKGHELKVKSYRRSGAFVVAGGGHSGGFGGGGGGFGGGGFGGGGAGR